MLTTSENDSARRAAYGGTSTTESGRAMRGWDAYDPNGYTLRRGLAASPPGWRPLVHRAFIVAAEHDVRIVQIKARWGMLRIYADPNATPHDSAAYREFVRVLRRLEIESTRYCQVCGVRATVRSDVVPIATLCAVHHGIVGRGDATLDELYEQLP